MPWQMRAQAGARSTGDVAPVELLEDPRFLSRRQTRAAVRHLHRRRARSVAVAMIRMGTLAGVYLSALSSRLMSTLLDEHPSTWMSGRPWGSSS
jgi:hypothetical protein